MEAGNYPERVTVSNPGRSGAPIILEADAGASVTMEGFDIEASYVQVTGFEITTRPMTTMVSASTSPATAPPA